MNLGAGRFERVVGGVKSLPDVVRRFQESEDKVLIGKLLSLYFARCHNQDSPFNGDIAEFLCDTTPQSPWTDPAATGAAAASEGKSHDEEPDVEAAPPRDMPSDFIGVYQLAQELVDVGVIAVDGERLVYSLLTQFRPEDAVSASVGLGSSATEAARMTMAAQRALTPDEPVKTVGSLLGELLGTSSPNRILGAFWAGLFVIMPIIAYFYATTFNSQDQVRGWLPDGQTSDNASWVLAALGGVFSAVINSNQLGVGASSIPGASLLTLAKDTAGTWAMLPLSTMVAESIVGAGRVAGTPLIATQIAALLAHAMFSYFVWKGMENLATSTVADSVRSACGDLSAQARIASARLGILRTDDEFRELHELLAGLASKPDITEKALVDAVSQYAFKKRFGFDTTALGSWRLLSILAGAMIGTFVGWSVSAGNDAATTPLDDGSRFLPTLNIYPYAIQDQLRAPALTIGDLETGTVISVNGTLSMVAFGARYWEFGARSIEHLPDFVADMLISLYELAVRAPLESMMSCSCSTDALLPWHSAPRSTVNHNLAKLLTKSTILFALFFSTQVGRGEAAEGGWSEPLLTFLMIAIGDLNFFSLLEELEEKLTAFYEARLDNVSGAIATGFRMAFQCIVRSCASAEAQQAAQPINPVAAAEEPITVEQKADGMRLEPVDGRPSRARQLLAENAATGAFRSVLDKVRADAAERVAQGVATGAGAGVDAGVRAKRVADHKTVDSMTYTQYAVTWLGAALCSTRSATELESFRAAYARIKADRAADLSAS